MRQHIKKNQQGATLLLSMVFMIAMLGVIGLAIDTGHLLVNKTRLQNAMDAASLSAATVLNGAINNSQAQATAAGIATFDLFKNAAGNSELSAVNLTKTNFTYSDNISQFLAGVGNTPSNFVRVRTDGLYINNFLIQIITGNSNQFVEAISTAGPIGKNCNLVPLVICADVDPNTGQMDKNCTDDTNGDGYVDCYGYNLHEESTLSTPPCPPSGSCTINSAVTAGNFTLLRWGSGDDQDDFANDVRQALSNTVDTCSQKVRLDNSPALEMPAVAAGVNDRFYKDTVTDIYDNFTHPTATTPALPDYKASQSTAVVNPGQIINNRVVAVPIGDCTGLQNGNTKFKFASNGSGNMSSICAFIRRPVIDNGSTPNYLINNIYIEMLDRCPAGNGQTNPNNPVVFGPYQIVLYKSENSQDS